MSMPQIPDINPSIHLKREDVVTLLLASVALEEMSLSHILNAEGEKLQAVLAAAAKCRHPDLIVIRDIHESAERTVSGITRMQMLLQMKMEDILRCTDRHCSPPCPGKSKSEKAGTAAGSDSDTAADGEPQELPFRLWGTGEGYGETGAESGPVRLKAHIGAGRKGIHRYLKYAAGEPAGTVELTMQPSDFRPDFDEQGLWIHGRGALGGSLPTPESSTDFVLQVTGRGRELAFRMQFTIPGRKEPHDSGMVRVVSGDLELS